MVSPLPIASVGSWVAHATLVPTAVARLRERHRLRAARRAADDELVRHAHAPLRLAWRAAELTEPKNRRDLARALRSLVRDASPRLLPGPAPVDRPGVRAAAGLIATAAARLDDVARPVAARGVILLDRLLTDADSPAYTGGYGHLDDYLVTALDALEAR